MSLSRIRPYLTRFSSSPQTTHKLHTTTTMEVEVKLRLPDSTAHQKLSNILAPNHTTTHFQQNMFFDTHTNILSKHQSTLRIRFYNLDTHATLTFKSKPNIIDGISQSEEYEEKMDVTMARACVAEPCRFFDVESRILKRVEERYGIEWRDMVCLGGFKNVRFVYEWIGLKLELDESLFEFGTCYEIECESDDPQKAKSLIEDLLNRNGIRFCYSKESKFGIFRSGKLPEFE